LPQVVAGIWQKFGKGANRFSVSTEAVDSPGSNHTTWRKSTMGRPNQPQPDQLTQALLEIEQRLNELNLGLEAWVSTTFVDSPTGLCGRVYVAYVGYARHGNDWRLLTRAPIPAYLGMHRKNGPRSREDTPEQYEAVPLLEAPRRVQIAALEVIPALTSKIQVKIKELQKAVGAARDLAGRSRSA
jgi:hypothetical protein